MHFCFHYLLFVIADATGITRRNNLHVISIVVYLWSTNITCIQLVVCLLAYTMPRSRMV